jgi:hypothetical protein
VAAFAHGKVVAAKSALAVVARHAAGAATARVMVEWCGRGHLSPLWHSGSHLVTFIATDFQVL